MKLKRLLSLTGFLTAILMFTSASLHAADLIRVGNAQAFAGGSDTVDVFVTTDTTYPAVEITLSYSADIFSYEEGSLVYNETAWNPAWGAPEISADEDAGTVKVAFYSINLDAAVPKSAVALKLFSVVLNVDEEADIGTEAIAPSGIFVSVDEDYEPVPTEITDLTDGSFVIQTAFTLSVEENVEASPGYATPVNIYLTNAKDAVSVEFTLTFDSDQLEYAESVELNQAAWQDGSPQPAEVTATDGEVKVAIYSISATAKIPVSNDPRWIAKIYLVTAEGAEETAENPLTMAEGIVVTVDENYETTENDADLVSGNLEILAQQSLRVSTDVAAPQGGSDEVKVYLKNAQTAVAVEAEIKFDKDQFTVEEAAVVFNKAIFSGSEASISYDVAVTDSTVKVAGYPIGLDSIPGSDAEKEFFSVMLQVNEDADPDIYELDISGMLTVRDENYETEEVPITSVTKGEFLIRSALELQVESLDALPLTKQTVNILLTNRDLVIGAEVVVAYNSLELAYEEGSLEINGDIWSAGLPTTEIEVVEDTITVRLYDLNALTTVPAGGSGQVLLSLDFTLGSILAVDDTSEIFVEGLAAVPDPDDPFSPLTQVATGIAGYIAVVEEVEPTEPEDENYLKVSSVVAAAGGATNTTKILLYSAEKDVAGVGFKFTFDQTKLQLTAVTEGSGIAGLALAAPVDLVAANADGEFVIAAAGTENLIAAGAEVEFLDVTLQVLEGVATGQVALTLQEASLSDAEAEDIPVTVTSGYVSVVIPTGPDLNSDGEVDIRDLWYYLRNPMMVLFEDLAACIAEILAQPLPETMLASAQDAVYTASAADGAALINLNTDFEIVLARFTFSYDNSYVVTDVQLSQALAGKVFIKKMFVEGKLVVDIISLTGLVPAELGSEMFSVAFRDASHQEADLTLEKVEVADRSGKVYLEAAKVNAAVALPKAFALSQNSPNPFNPSTTISYEIPESSGSVKVVMAVYNIRGQKVITLVDELKETGQYSVNWNGQDESGRRVSSGVYFYRMNAGDFKAVRKMVIVK
jgi:hypothetical protein